MAKAKIIENKEFYLYAKDRKSSINLSFLHNPNATYTFKLKRIEWKNLLNFLKQSKVCEECVLGFDISKNKVDYYPIEKCSQEIALIEKLFAKDSKEIKNYKRFVYLIKKYRLYNYISIKKNGISANLVRSKFIRFRKFCLANASKI